MAIVCEESKDFEGSILSYYTLKELKFIDELNMPSLPLNVIYSLGLFWLEIRIYLFELGSNYLTTLLELVDVT